MARRIDAITDVSGIKVGHWTDRRAATGCTVVLCEAGAMPGVDVRGASPGGHDTDLLKPGYSSQAVHAVVLTGGSLFGMASIPGVVRWCEENRIGITFARQRIPIVTGAVIFDLNTGRADVRPEFEAGYSAAAAATNGRVPEGSVGAGTGATVAKLMGADRSLKGGVGTASETFGDGFVVGALMVVNAVGDVVDSGTGQVIAGPRGDNGAFLDTVAGLRSRSRRIPEGNTTIGVIATNAKLTKEQTNRLAVIAHDGMARAIRPVHTTADGDTMFALATGEREIAVTRIAALETLAALAVERAIHKAVRAATPVAGVPSAKMWRQKTP